MTALKHKALLLAWEAGSQNGILLGNVLPVCKMWWQRARNGRSWAVFGLSWLCLIHTQTVLPTGVRNIRDVFTKYSVIYSFYLAPLQWFRSENLRAIHKALLKPHISPRAAPAVFEEEASQRREVLSESSQEGWCRARNRTQSPESQLHC